MDKYQTNKLLLQDHDWLKAGSLHKVSHYKACAISSVPFYQVCEEEDDELKVFCGRLRTLILQGYLENDAVLEAGASYQKHLFWKHVCFEGVGWRSKHMSKASLPTTRA